MNGLIALAGYIFLAIIIKKMVFPSKKGAFGLSFKEFGNNFLLAGNSKEDVKTINNKPHPQDPTKSQNSNDLKKGQQEEDLVGNTRIKSYRDFYPDYMNAKVQLTDESLNIDLGEKTIKDININGKNIPTLVKNKKEVEKLSSNNRKIGNVKGLKGAVFLKNDSMIKQAQPNIKRLQNQGQIREYSSNINEVKEIKGPVKTMFIGKFSSPNGFKVRNFINGIQGIQQVPGINERKNMQAVSGIKDITNLNLLGEVTEQEQMQLIGENRKKLNSRRLKKPKFLSYYNFEQDLEGKAGRLNVPMDVVHSQKASFKGKSSQYEKMETLSKEYNNPENKNLSQKEIIKMNQITNQLISEDKRRILSQPGHLPYLNRTEVNELNKNKQIYSNIYKMATQSGIKGISDKKSLRNIANKVSMLGRQKQEEASKQASKEVENKMPDINRNAFYKTITGDGSLSDKFIDYMSQFMDLDDIELSKDEMKKYREQAEKNMRERNELSPEAIEEEYNRLYKRAKKEKMLEKIFSSNLDEIKEITYDIINIPEIGISLFGEEEYYKLIRKVDKISDSEYKQIYNEIRENIMDEMYGRKKNDEKSAEKNEKRKRNRSSNRTSYQEYVQRRNQMQDVNSDIKAVLGIGNETDENSGIVAPIKIYTPNVINNEENNKAV